MQKTSMDHSCVRDYVNQYCRLRDVQYAAFERYARRRGLTAKELFVLDIIWFSPEGCLQSDICQRLSATKQTVSAIVQKFRRQGYLTLTESETDRRSNVIRLTPAGKAYAGDIILPAAKAEIDAMSRLAPEDIAQLVRLTALFSRHMEEAFDGIQEARA